MIIEIRECKPCVGHFIIKNGRPICKKIELEKIDNSKTRWSSPTTFAFKPNDLIFETIDKDYHKYQRGIVEYDDNNKKYIIICSESLDKDSPELEYVTREFHIPPAHANNVEIIHILEYNINDEGGQI